MKSTSSFSEDPTDEPIEGDPREKESDEEEVDAAEKTVIPGMSKEEFDSFHLESGPVFSLNLPADHFLMRYNGYGTAISDAYIDYWFMGGLFMLGTVADKKVKFVTSMDDFYPNIWAYILGDSSLARKTTAIKKALAMLKRVLGEQFMRSCIPNTFSPEAFTEHMDEFNHAPWIRDEAAGVLSVMQKDYMRGFKDDLMQLYDCSPITRKLRTKKGSEKSWFNVADPYLNMFFASTGAALGYNMNLIDKETGFLVRFLFSYPQNAKDKYMPLDTGLPIHSELEEICDSQLSTIRDRMNALPGCVVMTHSPDARAYYNAWQDMREHEASKIKDGYSSQIFSRLNPVVIKIAMLFEIGSIDFDPYRPIRKEYFVEACRLVDEYFMPITRAVYDLIGTANKENAIERIVLYLTRHDGKATKKEINRDVKIKSRELTEYLSTMVECDMVFMEPVIRENNKKSIYVFLKNNKVDNVGKVVKVDNVDKVEDDTKEPKDPSTFSTMPTLSTLATLSTLQNDGVECKDVTIPVKPPVSVVVCSPEIERIRAGHQKHVAKNKCTCHICGHVSDHELVPDHSNRDYVNCYICTSCLISHRVKSNVQAEVLAAPSPQTSLSDVVQTT